MAIPGSAIPNGSGLAVVSGVVLNVVAIATFLLEPQFIEAATRSLHFGEGQVGIVAAAMMAGSTLASLAAPLWVRRVPWRLAAAVTLLGLLTANLASMLFHEFIPFCVLQGLAGIFGGSLYSLSLIVLSDSRNPDRGFAYAVGAQTLYQVLGLAGGPWLIRIGGMNAMLVLFAALCVLGMLVVAFLPRAVQPASAHEARSRLFTPAVMFALAGCFLFYVNVNAYWTYIERIGTTANLDLVSVSNGLALATVASMAAVVLAAYMGARRGVLLPIGASAVAVIIAMLLLTGTIHLSAYVMSAVIYENAWNLSITYQYSTVNNVDLSRRGVALAPGFHNAGGTAGPAIAALFVSEHNHTSILWLVCISVLASFACFVVAMRLHRRDAIPAGS
jgi:DHA1 family inner membrane transport protein